MNLKTLSIHRQLFFISLLILGFSYLGFLFFLTPKIISGFLMQIIFLIDALNAHSGSLFYQPKFYIQLVVGLIFSFLLFRFLKSARNSYHQIRQTNKFVQSLKLTRSQGQYNIIKSSSPEAFTVGFFHSQVYFSQKLIKISSPEELSSILYHELSHVKNFDPLKNLIIDFIKNVTPAFPLKSWLFGQYQTLVEINCDLYSQSSFSHPTSLISALLKIQKFSQPQFVSNFSAQSERIKILVGRKSAALRSTLFTSFVVTALLFTVSGSLYKTDIFYQCDHLLKCFENIFTPDHIITPNKAQTSHCLNQ